MTVKINSYYSDEIDKVKRMMVREDGRLRNPFLFVSLSILGIAFNVCYLSRGLRVGIFLLYTIPLLAGFLYELHLMRGYKKYVLTGDMIKRMLQLNTVRIVNVLLFCSCGMLMLTEAVVRENFYYSGHSIYNDKINAYCAISYVAASFLSMLMFGIGNMVEKQLVIKNKKKNFAPPAVTGLLAIILYFFLKNLSYRVWIVLYLILFTMVPYAIGKIHFRYKNFNKKVGENDRMTDCASTDYPV